jgi:hypothetical protein
MLIAFTLLSNGMFDIVVNCCCSNSNIEIVKHSCCDNHKDSHSKGETDKYPFFKTKKKISCCEDLNLYYFTPKYFENLNSTVHIVKKTEFNIQQNRYLPIFQYQILNRQNQLIRDQFVLKKKVELSEISVFNI